MIAVVYEVGRYRALLSEVVGVGDVVVEIGPHICKSTDAYVSKASKAVLVDKGSDCKQDLIEYSSKHGNVEFVFGDARDFSTLELAKKHVLSCDVLAVDLGGGRFPDTVFKVWGTWSGVFKPKHSIIRCRGIAEFLKKAKVMDGSLPATFPDSGWLTEYGRGTPVEMKNQLDEFSHWVKL
ncbi:MAG: hypothetical protein KKD39_03870 [Candidatus Altiarchaeota archaeon]|nr:hypothetical protein [Candidatus Altiarchaeota archaeon]